MNDREPELRGGDERLADWVDGRMSDRDRERFLAEMRVNAQLKQDLETYERTVGVLRAALRAPMQPAPIADRVMAAIAAEKTKPAPARRPQLSFRSRPLWWSLLSAAALLLVALLVNELPSPPATTTNLVSHDAAAPQPANQPTAPAPELAGDAKPESTSKQQTGDAQGEVTKSLALDAGRGDVPTQGASEPPGGAKPLREGDGTRGALEGSATEDRKEAKSPAAPTAAVEREENLTAELEAHPAARAAVQRPVGNPPPESKPPTKDRDERAPFARGGASEAKDKAVGELVDDSVAGVKRKPTGGGGGGAVADPQGLVPGDGRAGGQALPGVAGSETWGDLGGRNTEPSKNQDKAKAEGEKSAPSPVSGRGGGRRGSPTPAGQTLAMVLVEGLVGAPEVPATAGLYKQKPNEDAPADPLRDIAKNLDAYRAEVDAKRLDEAGLRVAVQGFLRAAAVAGAEAVTAAFPTANGTVAMSPLLDASIEFDAPVGSPVGPAADKLAFDRTWVVEGARGEVAIVLQEIAVWTQERKLTLRSGESKPTTALPPLPASESGKSLPKAAGPAAGGPATGGPAGPAAPAPSTSPVPKTSPAPGGFVEGRLAERAQVVFRVRLHNR